MAPQTLQDLLRSTARSRPLRRIVTYPFGNVSTPDIITYSDLYVQACRAGHILRALPNFKYGAPILIHLDNHKDTLVWIWATLFAGGLPVPSSSHAFSNVPEYRQKHIQGLSTLLGSPICITSSPSLHLFGGDHNLKIHTIESLIFKHDSKSGCEPEREIDCESESKFDSQSDSCSDSQSDYTSDSNFSTGPTPTQTESDTAILMLTSGSTGNAKAVKLTHAQIFAAVAGKASVRKLPQDKPFLNWIGLDHVASLVEIHLQAMYLGVEQVHVHAADIISSPRTLLDLLSHHQVARSFAPNSFLARLVMAAESRKTAESSVNGFSGNWDLRSLTVLASGGEANDVETCIAASSLLSRYGAPPNVITTGFGMTETCAGAIFNLDCPNYDITHKHEFASLGKCMSGIEMRITLDDGTGSIRVAGPGEIGDLEVRGNVVFKGYYRNEEATAKAFTSDGWFRTGDRASIKKDGNLDLVGRLDDTININGIKINSRDVQGSVDRALSGYEQVSRAVSFSARPARSHTEQIVVAYVPLKWPLQPTATADINDKIAQATMACTGSRAIIFAIEKESMLPKSTLGKVSRQKMKKMFENGDFAECIESHLRVMEDFRRQNLCLPANDAEVALLQDFAETLEMDPSAVSVDAPIFNMGITSMDLIRLKRRIETRLSIELPIITLMTNPTVRSLANALDDLTVKESYNPVVTLRSEGEKKTPLWLIHPGVGEVLVFLGLSKEIDDRPVYALRARGFEGEGYFKSIEHAVSTYYAAIKRQQPTGPYAIAGYSYGTMLAFEVAKLLERDGEVKFVGSFNLPPHIKTRMSQLNWNMCLLHLAYFLGLTTEAIADSIGDAFRDLPRENAMKIVLGLANQARMNELGLDERGLANWAELAYNLQHMAVDYEPSGSVGVIDVFHATPLAVAAKSRQDWVDNHLSKWSDFCRTNPVFHEVGGAHYTMLGPEYVGDFARVLRRVLMERGL